MAATLAWPVSGFFTKTATIEELLAGVEAVLAGHRVIGELVLEGLLDRLAEANPSIPRGAAAQLSPTELDILTRVGRAQSIATIAANRGVSHKTVRNHLTNICRKLQLRGRAEVMLCAVRMGLADSA